jgi:multiple sugar transport system permease protein
MDVGEHRGDTGVDFADRGDRRMNERARPKDNLTALPFVVPFVFVYALMFIYPTALMVGMSLTNSSLTVAGEWVGWSNYVKLLGDKRFGVAIVNTLLFVVVTVGPGTLVGLGLAILVNRLSGWRRSAVLAAFFLPYVLPVSTVTTIAYLITTPGAPLGGIYYRGGQAVAIWNNLPTFIPAIGVLTIWWTVGFTVLIFVAGLKTLPTELYDAARVDGANRWVTFTSITWPLIWPVTALVVTLQTIMQFKVFDQVFLMATSGRTDPTMVLVQYVYVAAFQRNQAGYGSAVAVGLYIVVLVLSVLQWQATRLRSTR